MGMSMSLIPRQTIRQTQRLVLTQAQRVALVTAVLQWRLELIAALRGNEEKFQPRGECPGCGRRLTPVEVITGFNDNPRDYTTACSGCGTRFEPVLAWNNQGGGMQVAFYCSVQVLEQLRMLAEVSVEDMRQRHAAVYYSAVVHHGSLQRAFALIDIEYAFDEFVDPCEKVRPFLGMLTDKMIAEISGLAVAVVRRMRREVGVPRCTQRRQLEFADQF